MEDQVHRAVVGDAATAGATRRRGLGLLIAAPAVAILLAVAVVLGVALAQGWGLHVIETGSMAPRYQAGSLAVVQAVDPAEVRPGTTVVFEDPLARGRLVAHRVVKRLRGSSPVWETKGDANAESDPAPVHASALRGRVRWSIPEVGRVVSELEGRSAFALVVGVPIAVLLFTEIVAVRRRGTGYNRGTYV